jgi:hypothetical protein
VNAAMKSRVGAEIMPDFSGQPSMGAPMSAINLQFGNMRSVTKI